MKRNLYIIASLKIAIGILLFLFSPTALGQSNYQIQPNVNYFTSGIPTNEFDYLEATTVNHGDQIQSNWCWAACVQMVLNYHGLQVTQLDAVTRIYGSPYVNQPANTQQVLTALSGWAPNSVGSNSYINAYSGYTSVPDIINALGAKWPLIVGMTNPNGGVGHAYVMTAIFYSNQYDIYGQLVGHIPDKVVLRDPWPGNANRQEYSWNEFQSRCMMAVRVWITR